MAAAHGEPVEKDAKDKCVHDCCPYEHQILSAYEKLIGDTINNKGDEL